MARTTIEEARTCKTWTYLTPTEFGALNAFAKTLDVSVSTVIRALVQRAVDDFPEGIGSVPGVPARETLSVPLSAPPEPAAPVPPPDAGWAGSGCSGVPMPPWEDRPGGLAVGWINGVVVSGCPVCGDVTGACRHNAI